MTVINKEELDTYEAFQEKLMDRVIEIVKIMCTAEKKKYYDVESLDFLDNNTVEAKTYNDYYYIFPKSYLFKDDDWIEEFKQELIRIAEAKVKYEEREKELKEQAERQEYERLKAKFEQGE